MIHIESTTRKNQRTRYRLIGIKFLALAMLLAAQPVFASMSSIGVQQMGVGYVGVTTNLFDSGFTLREDLSFDPVAPGTNTVFNFDTPSFSQTAGFDLGIDGSGSLMASADLSTGELKGFVSADNRPGGPGTFAQQTTQSQIFERIHIVEPIVGSTMVTLTMDIEGSETFSNGVGTSSGNQFISALIQVAPVVESGSPIVGFKSNTVDGPLDGQKLQVSFELYETQPYFDVTFSLDLTQQIQNSFGTIDYGNTATVGIELEPGFSFTSGSGEFLTAVVPIPPAMYLFASTLILFLRARRSGV